MTANTRTIFVATLMCFVLLATGGPLKEGDSGYKEEILRNESMRSTSLANNELHRDGMTDHPRILSSISSVHFGRKLIATHKHNLDLPTNQLQSRYRERNTHGESSKDLESSSEQKRNRCLLAALSEIAVIRVADQNVLRTSTSENVSPKKLNDPITVGRRSQTPQSGKDNERERLTKKNGMKSVKTKLESTQKFHCYAIREVYIPEAMARMPAYACRFGERTFILSSPKFQQERRSYFDVDVNAEVIQQLSQAATSAIKDFETKIIPAILVLRSNSNGYKIQSSKDKQFNEHEK